MHIALRVWPSLADNQSLAEAACWTVDFKDDCIYRHATAHFNFTTYNLQRNCDLINPG
jgi:hypothetical protein